MNIAKRLFIGAVYAINGSKKYENTKRFFYNFLENDQYRFKKYVDFFMMILIFASVFILIEEVKNHLNVYFKFFNDYVISIIFMIEYTLRLWVYDSSTSIIIAQYEKDTALSRDFRLRRALYKVMRSKFEHIRSISSIIDLLAIVPFFHELRLLRIFILFRIFKLFRYTRSVKTFASVLLSKKFEFITLLIFASIIIFVSSVLVYIMEAHLPESPIKTLFDAFYWSVVTISTVGYGDIVTVSEAGRIVAVIVITSGIAVMAFTTSLVVSAFTEKIEEIKEIKNIEDIAKLKKIYLICGYKEIGRQVALKLKKDGLNIVVLDKEKKYVDEAVHDGFIAFDHDSGLLSTYENLKLNINTQVKYVLCLEDSDIDNIYTILTVRSISKQVEIISILQNKQNRKKLELAGVSNIVFSQEFIGLIAKEYIGQPVAFELIHALRSETNGIQISEILVDDVMIRYNGSIADIDSSRFKLLLLGIYKSSMNHFLFNPIENTLLETGDMLIIVGDYVFIEEFKKYLHTKSDR
ncbi:ion transporter [Sulfurimonas sp. HSL-1716]|uniref:ion transporter n=1 Tax=Hydrocurvibacter sulfurireducens TaxID=3131937 RepID=UPI0031F7C6DA